LSSPASLIFLLLSLAACGQEGRTTGDPGGSGATSGGDPSGGDPGGGQGASGPGGAGAGGGATGGAAPGRFTVDAQTSWHQPELSASLHFAPVDDLEAQVLGELGKAQTSIDLAFFNIRMEEVRDLLVAKMAAGVDVRVVLDKKQQDLDYNTMGEELVQLGVPVTLVENTKATNATMHDKFAVVDGHLVMTGSANYSYTAMHVSDEDLLTVDSVDLASRYQNEMDELIAGGSDDSPPYVSGAKLQAWMGPEDGLSGLVAAELDAAQSHVLLAMFQLNTDGLVDALIAAKQRGVTVVVVLDQVQASDAAADADEALAAAGIPVILAENTGGMAAEMHSKFCAIDHSRLVLGSYNWTNLGSFYNDENLVVVDDPHLTARAEGKLAMLLDAYDAPSPGTLGLTTGAQDVAFEVGNVSLGQGVTLTIQSIDGGPFATPLDLGGASITAPIEAGTRVRYRYAIRDDSGVLLEEAGEHAFVVPYAPGPFQVRDAFVP
jgi:hypothetical protein